MGSEAAARCSRGIRRWSSSRAGRSVCALEGRDLEHRLPQRLVGAGFGVEQALSGRYATGSAAFWSATLVFWAARLASLPCGRSRRTGEAVLTALTVLLLGFVARDQHSYDRTLARQAAAAERVIAAFERGGETASADLADVGVDLRTARADTALILRVRAMTDPDGRHTAAE